MKKSIIIIFSLIALKVAGQQIINLVPNANFEILDSCFSPIGNIWKISGWTGAIDNIYCSSDYFNKCQLNHNWQPSKPMNLLIDSGAAGITLSGHISGYREYLQTKFDFALIKDSIYVLNFRFKPVYIPSQVEWGVNRIEALITSYEVQAPLVNGFIPGTISTIPSLFETNNYTDTLRWYNFKQFFKSNGDEMYLTIGLFSNDTLFSKAPLGYIHNNQIMSAYYLIDDVLVYKASDTIVRSLPEPILPNVFSPNQDGVNEVYEIDNLPENSTLEVFNRWGAVVFKEAPYQNNWPGNAPDDSPLADGVYFAILTYQDQSGRLQQKKQTVHVLR